ncbi:hypothetical protein J2129_002635 [Methanofollis sp. W23]|uniref:hypothetical protein n=1 Tax=Methanofollis sp. W23 TaxID=2817849 RepID=UPI001E140D26|nr:hypothetical protein [Methanofollis sp. W23]MBP2147181.1 hypothetical protein [Methanofollis sp. W23]
MERKKTRSILALVVTACLVVAAAGLLLIAPAFVETTLSVNSYVIEVTGLSGIPVDGTATIMVPLPVNTDGEQVMSEETFAEGQVEGWNVAVQDTPYGRMLAFTTTERNASDIFAPFGVGEHETKEEPRLLAPVLRTPDNTSLAEYCQVPDGAYTTAVFLDGLAPGPEDQTQVSFSLEYRGGGGMKHLVKEDTLTTTVKTVVPVTASGVVQVPARYQVIAGGVYF